MAGDTATRYRRWQANGFQSTPTNFMAGDQLLITNLESHTWFQSTPTNFMAGDHG